MGASCKACLSALPWSMARGSSTMFLVGLLKVKARKSILCTEGSPEVEINNTCLILLCQPVTHIVVMKLYILCKWFSWRG